MSYVVSISKLPVEMQFPMLEVLEAFRADVREQYAVRREDFDALRAVVADLALAQKRTEQRLDRLEAVVAELAAAQKRTEQRVEELAAAQKRTEQRVEELAAAQKRTEDVLQKLVIRVARNTGKLLELDYRDKAYSYFGTLLRKVKVVSLQDLEPNLEQHLSDDEMRALLPLDLLVYGQVRHAPTPTDVYLAVEVSTVVDANDVLRASQRAALLRKAGYRAVPAAAGEDVTEGATDAARDAAVLLVQDGAKLYWDPALAQALAA